MTTASCCSSRPLPRLSPALLLLSLQRVSNRGTRDSGASQTGKEVRQYGRARTAGQDSMVGVPNSLHNKDAQSKRRESARNITNLKMWWSWSISQSPGNKALFVISSAIQRMTKINKWHTLRIEHTAFNQQWCNQPTRCPLRMNRCPCPAVSQAVGTTLLQPAAKTNTNKQEKKLKSLRGKLEIWNHSPRPWGGVEAEQRLERDQNQQSWGDHLLSPTSSEASNLWRQPTRWQNTKIYSMKRKKSERNQRNRIWFMKNNFEPVHYSIWVTESDSLQKLSGITSNQLHGQICVDSREIFFQIHVHQFEHQLKCLWCHYNIQQLNNVVVIQLTKINNLSQCCGRNSFVFSVHFYFFHCHNLISFSIPTLVHFAIGTNTQTGRFFNFLISKIIEIITCQNKKSQLTSLQPALTNHSKKFLKSHSKSKYVSFQ